MNGFMKRAIDLAIDNVKKGGQPFGAVLVKENTIVSEGTNTLHELFDISGHAELVAIRQAQQQLQTNDLSGYTMYASGTPCPMCLAAMYFVGITDIYYCASLAELAKAGLGTSKIIYDDLQKSAEERTIQLQQIPLQDGQVNPLTVWQQRQRKA